MVTDHFVAREGYMTLWIGYDRRLVMYPCNDNTMMNFVAIHPSGLSASKGDGKFEREFPSLGRKGGKMGGK